MSRLFDKMEQELREGWVGYQRRSTLSRDQIEGKQGLGSMPNVCVSCGDPGKYTLNNPASGEPEIFCKECGAVTQALRRANG